MCYQLLKFPLLMGHRSEFKPQPAATRSFIHGASAQPVELSSNFESFFKCSHENLQTLMKLALTRIRPSKGRSRVPFAAGEKLIRATRLRNHPLTAP